MRQLRHDLGLVLQCLLDGHAGGGGGLFVGQVLGGLAEAVARRVEQNFVLAGRDGGKGGVAANLQFGELHVGLR